MTSLKEVIIIIISGENLSLVRNLFSTKERKVSHEDLSIKPGALQ